MLSGKKIIVGVTGSIAAYKAALLVRLLVKDGAEVRVVMTEAASHFVGELTFSNLSQSEVFSGLWDGTWTEHVHLGTWADAMVIAPCTANTLAKMAHGICDNALTAVYLSSRCPVMVAPAMDADMYIHPSMERNLHLLKQDGIDVIEPGTGFLASGLHGQGRLAEPEEMLAAIRDRLQSTPLPLAGKKILISAGPTREHLDPVRFMSNGSTGTMGYALAAEAKRQGAEVTLVSGPCNPPIDPGVEPVRITSAADLFSAMVERAPDQDVVIMSAAVADYTPAQVADQKIKKKDGDLSIPMERTQDILKHLGAHKPPGQTLIGFALETQHGLANAQRKLEKKNLDFIVLNILSEKGAGFGTSTNKITLVDRNGGQQDFPLKSKTEVAKDILAHLSKQYAHEHP
ncbi:UNVERIFIED_CONTAM: hypothetical protein GTU68_029137 [Idotea baltica]|nr:hypothetical protein [Idotea baltica]